MGEVRHTAGPWSADKYGQLRSPDGKQVDVWGCGIAWVSRDDEAEANARLIAASPDLLEALRGARQTILDLKNARWSEAEGSDEEWVAEIDAAIAKATGSDQ